MGAAKETRSSQSEGTKVLVWGKGSGTFLPLRLPGGDLKIIRLDLICGVSGCIISRASLT
jgi:hypothetical protein